MKKWFLAFLNTKNKNSYYLAFANVFLVLFLIIFSNLKLIPLSLGNFIFFTLLVLAFTLYRPGWVFLFFIGSIALENINLAPVNLNLLIRPYQFFGGLLFLALFIRYISRRINLKLPKFSWQDFLIFIIPLAAFLQLTISPNKAAGLKLIIVLFSFCILYLLTKVYIQDIYDLKKILPYIFGSSIVIIFYGFWQNLRFANGLASFEVMPGRPNSTLMEADWFGLYLLLLLSASYALIFYLTKKSSSIKKLILTYVYLFFVFIALIISVSRSAWLGAIATTILFLFYVFTGFKINIKNWQWKLITKIKPSILFVFILSLGAVYFFNLTSFQLFNRAKSTATGLQKITISCEKEVELPDKINKIEELAIINCRHINLEEIDSEKASNKFIAEIYRTDPNVNVRSEIYKKAWSEIKIHPLIGVGFENVAIILGQDGRGASLNSSNIFLEIWLGSGILGFLAFVYFLIYLFLKAVRNIWLRDELEERVLGLFVLISGFGIIVFNLFNAGIMLGIFWVWLGIANSIKTEKYENRN
ncbi:MAG: O-antigen ligase family protein [Candidatus Moraniibacteriota bacterium]